MNVVKGVAEPSWRYEPIIEETKEFIQSEEVRVIHYHREAMVWLILYLDTANCWMQRRKFSALTHYQEKLEGT